MLLRTLRSNQALLALCCATAITMSGQGVISPILPLYAQTFGVSVALVGMAVSAFGLARLFVNLPAGLAAGVFGRRRGIIFGAALFAGGNLAAGLAADIWLLIFCRLVAGAGSSMFLTVGHVIVADLSTPENRGRYMSYLELSFLTGISLGPVIGGFMAELFGYQSPFFLVAVLSTIGSVWALLRIPETRPARAQHGSAGSGVRLSELVHPPLLGLAVVALTTFLTRAGARLGIIPLIGAAVGLSPGQIGLVYTGTIGVEMGLMPIAGAMADRINRRIVLVISLLVHAAGPVILMVWQDPWGFIVASVVLGLGTALGGPSLPSYAADVAPRGGGAGLTMGLYRTYGDIGFLIGGPLLGWIADASDFSGALASNAALLVLAAAVFWLLSRSRAAPSSAHETAMTSLVQGK